MNRRATLLFLSIVLASIVLQVSLLPVFIIPPFKPDLLLVIMVFIALRSSFKVGAPVAWLLGLLDDVVSGLYLGLNAATESGTPSGHSAAKYRSVWNERCFAPAQHDKNRTLFPVSV